MNNSSQRQYHLIELLTFTLLALFIVPSSVLCQSGPPIPPPISTHTLSFWPLETPPWETSTGLPARTFTNLNLAPSWDYEGTALSVDTNAPAFLQLCVFQDGKTNISLASGSLEIWCQPNWTSVADGGPGPGAWATLWDIGQYIPDAAAGAWLLAVDPSGSNLVWLAQSGGSNQFLWTPIDFDAGDWHQVVATWSSSNICLYVDGALATNAGPILCGPSSLECSNDGFCVGSLGASGTNAGTNQFQGQLQWLVSYAEPLSLEQVSNSYTQVADYITYFGYNAPGEGGGFHSDNVPTPPGGGTNGGGGGSPEFIAFTPPASISTTNYAAYNELYLTITNDATNAYVSACNTLSNLTYQILTNSSLANTNWGLWQTLSATNSITPAPPIVLNSNAPLFFKAALVWSTCTNYSPPLPDWWAMLYFGSTACVDPNANPSGDGIDNWDKFRLGLNPNVAYVSPLIVLPPSGYYTVTPAVTIFSLTSETIKYTTNGSTPSATNGMSIASGVTITNLPANTFTLKAWESGLTPNVVSSSTYTIIPAAPTFSVPGGAVSNGTSLQITCVTVGSVVRYTTDGTDPTTNSVQIQPTNILVLTTNETIKAAAWINGLVGPIAAASYIVQSAPTNDDFANATTLSGPSGEAEGTLVYSTLEQFEITNSTFLDNWEYNYNLGFYEFASGSVWYKWTAPSNGNVFFDMPESGGIYYFPTTTNSDPNSLTHANWNGDGTFAATSNVTYYLSEIYERFETPGPFAIEWFYTGSMVPIFTPPPGTYYAGQPVTLSCSDPEYYIFYTLDGSSPVSGSEPSGTASYVPSGGSVVLNQTATINAISWYSSVSATVTGTYTIVGNTNPTMVASAPIFSPTNTNFVSSLTVTLTCTNTNSTVFYTLDGTTPSRASQSVPSGGTVTLSNSALLNAVAWATNTIVSPVTTAIYVKDGEDSDGDGIPDTGEVLIGSNPFSSDANAASPSPFAHGLNNMQVYQNQSVLIADNYSTESDGVPDWWLVKYGYSVTTPATALGANGQTLASDFSGGINPNLSSSSLLSGPLPAVDFHIVAGPSNLPVMVLDNVNTNYVSYVLFCTPVDTNGNPIGPKVLEQMNADTALEFDGPSQGRYFSLPQPLTDGNWSFVLNAADHYDNYTMPSTPYMGQATVDEYLFDPPVEYNEYNSTTNAVFTMVTYTNHAALKESVLAEELRASMTFWQDFQYPLGFVYTPFIYSTKVQPVTPPTYWGVGQFDYNLNFLGQCSAYFTNFSATANAYTTIDELDGGRFYGDSFNPLFEGPYPPLDSETNWEMSYNSNVYGDGWLFNQFGLETESVAVQINSDAPIVLYPGDAMAVPNPSDTINIGQNLETPTFRTLDYYFEYRNVFFEDAWGENFFNQTAPPFGQATFVPWANWTGGGALNSFYVPVAVTNPLVIAQVGKPVPLQTWRSVRAYRPNGDVIMDEVWSSGDITTNLCFWMEADLDQAYLCDPVTGDVPRTSQTNYDGTFKIDTNTAVKTGIVSSDFSSGLGGDNPLRQAQFTPTQTGKVILTTKPGLDGTYGELVVYVIDMQVDKDHNGIMDNRDLTSVTSPMNFWVNNDVDRWHTIDVTDEEQDDLQTNGMVLDCDYQNGIGQYAIPCTRDLEDYARLWIPGLTNLMQVLPTGYGINLQWRNNTGAGIRLFGAADADGGTNYLFDGATATNQIDTAWYPCYGYVTNQPLAVSAAAWADLDGLPPSDHFIFCGTSIGNDELVLQVTNQWGGEVGEASVFLNLKDIKQMYERWTVGDDPDTSPTTIAVPASDGLPTGAGAFQYNYNAGIDSTTPYILFVHGWNLPPFEKDRFAETTYKRLYWQGYQGRFGSFRWPTYYAFPLGELSLQSVNPQNFDGSEYNAWLSSTGLKNRLVALNIQYPEQVYVLAHSQGNVVTGEALRLTGANQLVNVYVATQAAIPSHAYDPTTPLRDSSASTPDRYAQYWTNGAPCYFNGVSGAGTYVNFYNPNDWALTLLWPLDQGLKPDSDFGYLSSSDTFYEGPNPTEGQTLNFPADTYTIFPFCDEGRDFALGSQVNVGGAFQVGLTYNQVDLSSPPYNFRTQHKYHSGEFRSDNMSRAAYWKQVLIQMGLK